MKKKRFIVFICSILFLLASPLIYVSPVYSDFYVYAYDNFYQKDITIYWAETNEPITMEWDVSVGAAYYECELDWMQGSKVLQTYSFGTTTNTQISMTAPRAGVFIARIRACDSINRCSIWVSSTDSTYAIVDGEHKGWLIIFTMSGPGPIIID